MKNILYITESNLKAKYPNGGEIVSINNLKILKYLSSYNIITYSLYATPTPIRKLKKLIYGIYGYYYPINKKLIKDLIDIIIEKKISYVYIDNSKLGLISYFIKNHFKSKIKVITYFHNNEVSYFKDKNKKSILKKIILHSIKKSQDQALNTSDSCFFISKDEMDELSKHIDRDYVIPIYIKDNFDENITSHKNEEDYLLFLGSLFFPNIEAVRWLKKYVMPYVPYNLLIVGKNFENMKNELEAKNIHVIGSVEKTGQYIKNANIILSPIFSGAGLKVKIAESLMYGKKIIANDFALTGYNKTEIKNFVLISNDAQSFIQNINENFLISKKYYPEIRNYFTNNYSKESILKKMGDILEKI
ncbi:glycosyltransferase family 4 protein [Providencia sneebia]|uniref:Glycosyltransferase n=1 Tax=Providencia sneebia DSM 19967 TaxID=1141660 RepID=K8WMQ5_9GAMM|nr:glycosyltransferase [Providencia sneebia]EKT61271.1 hypothetical protein OO7_01161 [Providencia sneebia DSM 19967]